MQLMIIMASHEFKNQMTCTMYRVSQ